ncbi:MAG: orotate phosphoribosyltransferase [Pseudomonadota bacterium]
MQQYQEQFIQYAIDCGVLKFGEFTLKSGRSSPYFFNTGLFNTGARLQKLGHFFARALIASGLRPDVLFGPAYKGIPLVSATSIALAQEEGMDTPFAFNRKEAKDHGEGGNLVGSALKGKVLILDDVITAGTSVRESVHIIVQTGATPCGVLIALDRQEKGKSQNSAIEDVEKQFGIPVVAIVRLGDIITFLENDGGFPAELTAIREYRNNYGIS